MGLVSGFLVNAEVLLLSREFLPLLSGGQGLRSLQVLLHVFASSDFVVVVFLIVLEVTHFLLDLKFQPLQELRVLQMFGLIVDAFELRFGRP